MAMETAKPPANFNKEGAGHTKQHKPSGGIERDAHPKTKGVNQAPGFTSPNYTHGIFNPPPATGAYNFRGTQKKGVLRTSGKGHMLGCKK